MPQATPETSIMPAIGHTRGSRSPASEVMPAWNSGNDSCPSLVFANRLAKETAASSACFLSNQGPSRSSKARITCRSKQPDPPRSAPSNAERSSASSNACSPRDRKKSHRTEGPRWAEPPLTSITAKRCSWSASARPAGSSSSPAAARGCLPPRSSSVVSSAASSLPQRAFGGGGNGPSGTAGQCRRSSTAAAGAAARRGRRTATGAATEAARR
mmetsp:Transcript_13514/g.37443  ORF Transcript_13514/g.37443 Transcript_13514/m.37443 type:complete len:214 (-) Transcript_13514:180-821(-)